MEGFDELIAKAGKAYSDNFSNETYFERAIFFSWHCSLASCKYCFMSTQKGRIRHPELGVRHPASLMAEALLCKALNWKIGFLAGGYNAYKFDRFHEVARLVSRAYGEKLWLNIIEVDTELF